MADAMRQSLCRVGNALRLSDWQEMINCAEHDLCSSFPRKRESSHTVELPQAPRLDAGLRICCKSPTLNQTGNISPAAKAGGAKHHLARFPAKLPEFFIRTLTQPGDLVVDIFAGSNTTGQVAEAESRRWLAFELSREYLAASAFRFMGADDTDADMAELHRRIMADESADLRDFTAQPDFLAAAAAGS